MRQKKKKHVGPGKLAVTLYADEALYKECKARARSLGFSTSSWIFRLVRKELRNAGPMVIEPDPLRPFKAAESQLAGFAE